MKTVAVSSLVSQVRRYLQQHVNLEAYMISGELSNVRHVSGNVYFDLKDEKGQISCTLWRSYAAQVPFRLEDGQAVLVHGRLEVYEKRGTLQLQADHVEMAGLGALYLELEKRKKRLQELGYFDVAHKLPMPQEIRSIGIVTGASTAALQDAMKTIRSRWPMMEVHLFPASVQGENAPAQIVQALKKADGYGLDAVLLIRGGGSFEDLFCFNDERIVDALYHMKTYTVTGIGHEIDTSLADLAADHRALTPTAAAQWITPDQRQVMASLQELHKQLIREMRQLFSDRSQQLMLIQLSGPFKDPKGWIQDKQTRLNTLQLQLDGLCSRMTLAQKGRIDQFHTLAFNAMQKRLFAARSASEQMRLKLQHVSPSNQLSASLQLVNSQREQIKDEMASILKNQQTRLDQQKQLLSALSWESVLERGFSVVMKDGHPITQASQLEKGELVHITFAKGNALAGIIKKES